MDLGAGHGGRHKKPKVAGHRKFQKLFQHERPHYQVWKTAIGKQARHGVYINEY